MMRDQKNYLQHIVRAKSLIVPETVSASCSATQECMPPSRMDPLKSASDATASTSVAPVVGPVFH
jgi:hypothetical protein